MIGNMITSFHNKKNAFDFLIRSRSPLSRRHYTEHGVNLNTVLSKFPPDDVKVIINLIDKYNFEPYLRKLSEQSFLDNMLHLVLLDRFRSKFQPPLSRIFDIGSKNFCYAPAIFEFFKSLDHPQSCPQQITVEGIELDARRLYRNFYTRNACANYYKNLIPNAQYNFGDFLQADPKKPYDVICHFFPFLDLDALLDWGLPARYFQPLGFIKKAFKNLVPNGYYFMSNLSDVEYQHGRSLAEACGFTFIADDIVKHSFTSGEIYVSLFCKQCEMNV